MFLRQAFHLAKDTFDYRHNREFVRVLVNLWKIQKTDPEQHQAVIFHAYGGCINHVKEALGIFHLTSLVLWVDFIVYLDSSSANEAKAVVDTFNVSYESRKRTME